MRSLLVNMLTSTATDRKRNRWPLKLRAKSKATNWPNKQSAQDIRWWLQEKTSKRFPRWSHHIIRPVAELLDVERGNISRHLTIKRVRHFFKVFFRRRRAVVIRRHPHFIPKLLAVADSNFVGQPTPRRGWSRLGSWLHQRSFDSVRPRKYFNFRPPVTPDSVAASTKEPDGYAAIC